jgi:hypothetical protein
MSQVEQDLKALLPTLFVSGYTKTIIAHAYSCFVSYNME